MEKARDPTMGMNHLKRHEELVRDRMVQKNQISMKVLSQKKYDMI